MTIARAFLMASFLTIQGCAQHPGQGGPAASDTAAPRAGEFWKYWLLAGLAAAILLNADVSLKTGGFVASGSGQGAP